MQNKKTCQEDALALIFTALSEPLESNGATITLPTLSLLQLVEAAIMTGEANARRQPISAVGRNQCDSALI